MRFISETWISKMNDVLFWSNSQPLCLVPHSFIHLDSSGKSTQLPQYLVESGGWASPGENDFCVLCTQPRRIAAITLADRVSKEMSCQLGSKVGYCVRFQSNFDESQTQILFATDGVVVREAQAEDPLLSKYSVVIVDEAHERSLNSDVVLGLLKKIKRKRRDLRIVICSATIDAQAFVDYFVGNSKRRREVDNDNGAFDHRESGKTVSKTSDDNNNSSSSSNGKLKATIISVDGRQYPVDVMYLREPAQNYLRGVVETAHQICQQEKGMTGGGGGGRGDILCFLPTGEDIDSGIRMAEQQYFQDDHSVDLLPLYGTLPYHMQLRVFDSNPPSSSRQRGGKNFPRQRPRRIIFATNIAETSVTVPNISHVVDSGLVKLPYFDPKTGLERLIVCPTSQASAKQRAGRAGRVQSGKCYRLYTESFYTSKMEAQTPPEILRTNLTTLILALKALGIDNILSFDLMDVPSVDSLSHGLETLYALGAIDDRTHLTDLGMEMSSFPTDPRVARMLLESLSAGCSWEVLAVASALQVRDLLYKPRASGGGSSRQMLHHQQQLDYEAAMSEIVDPSGDHVTYANLLAEMDDKDLNENECKDRFINYLALKRAVEVRRQLAGVLRKFGRVQAMGFVPGAVDGRSRKIRKCVTAGFFVNVAKLQNDGRYYTIRKRIPVTPSSTSVFMSMSQQSAATSVSEYIVFGETLDGQRGGIELKAVSSIEARWLRELAPNYWE